MGFFEAADREEGGGGAKSHRNRHRFHLGTSFLILLNFLESLRIVLINMATIVMSTKMDNGYPSPS